MRHKTHQSAKFAILLYTSASQMQRAVHEANRFTRLKTAADEDIIRREAVQGERRKKGGLYGAQEGSVVDRQLCPHRERSARETHGDHRAKVHAAVDT